MSPPPAHPSIPPPFVHLPSQERGAVPRLQTPAHTQNHPHSPPHPTQTQPNPPTHPTHRDDPPPPTECHVQILPAPASHPPSTRLVLASLLIHAPAAAIYSLMTHYEGLASIIPSLTQSIRLPPTPGSNATCRILQSAEERLLGT